MAATRPAVGRADIDVFLRRLALAESAGRISRLTRIEQIGHVKLILARMRLAGVTRPGRAAAGLGDGFALEARDVPERPGRGEPCRDLPAEIMTQLCVGLGALTHGEIRVATELLMDTGRRPEEICALPWDCLARDSDRAATTASRALGPCTSGRPQRGLSNRPGIPGTANRPRQVRTIATLQPSCRAMAAFAVPAAAARTILAAAPAAAG